MKSECFSNLKIFLKGKKSRVKFKDQYLSKIVKVSQKSKSFFNVRNLAKLKSTKKCQSYCKVQVFCKLCCRGIFAFLLLLFAY